MFAFLTAILAGISTAQADPLSAQDLARQSTAQNERANTEKRVRLSRSQEEQLSGRINHGFRVGYGYINADPEKSDVLKSEWLYLIGYEVNQKIIGGSWINVLFAQNISVVGLNQGIVIPSGNVLFGFELQERFQVLSGLNLVPAPDSPDTIPLDTHMVAAVGWTPQVGDINIPFHVIAVPDVEDKWRGYITTGVNW